MSKSTVVRGARKAANRFLVEVDYTKLFTDMVQAGNYDSVNEDITAESFPLEGDGVVESELIMVHFDRVINSEDAIKKMEQMGLVPCKIEHLLALGAKYPDLQKQYLIICLGSSWVNPRGLRCVPYLGWCDERGLGLYWFGYGWSDDCRFAAVRK